MRAVCLFGTESILLKHSIAGRRTLAGNPGSAENYNVSDFTWNHFPAGRRQTANRRSVESTFTCRSTAAIVLKLEAARGAASGKNRSD